MATEKKEAEVTTDAKAMLEDNVGRKIKFADRVVLEIIKDTKHYKVGQIIEPHRVKAEVLLKNKIAKEVK